MTRQIRTWHERETAEGEPQRWDVSINGVPVPGGYIVQTGEAAFEAHYPHLAAKTLATLEEAKRRIEFAPPITTDGMALGRVAEDVDDEGLVSTDEAGELLGTSRFRVNAMVANGVLAGVRRNGKVLVSRASVEARLSRANAEGPAGRFVHAFVHYRPAGPDEPEIIAEVDPEDAREYERAERFLKTVMENGEADSVEVLDYRRAMARCSAAKRAAGEADAGRLIGPVPLDRLLAGATS